MTFEEFNTQLSLYIPFIKKWQATNEYVENAFEYAFIGHVRSVDFAPRTDGIYSAYVYLDWYENEFAYNWQKVIYAKDPSVPAHLYHTVGPNFWILMENSPYNIDPIVQTNETNTPQKGLVCFTQNDDECEYECRCDKCKLTYKIEECNREIVSANKKYTKDIKRSKCEITKLKDDIVRFEDFKYDYEKCAESNCGCDLCKAEVLLGVYIASRKLLKKEHAKDTLRRHTEIASLKEKRTSIGLKTDYKKCMIDLEEVNKEYVKYKVRTERKIKKLECNYDKCEINPQPLSIVSYKCNSCSIKVSFSAENEATLSAKKHLCNGCYGRIYKNNDKLIRS